MIDGIGSVSYVFDSAAGFDAVVEAHPLLVIGVLAGAYDVLVALVVGMLVEDPGAARHTDGVAAGEVGAQVRTVTVALIATALEILLLKECDLERERWEDERESERARERVK